MNKLLKSTALATVLVAGIGGLSSEASAAVVFTLSIAETGSLTQTVTNGGPTLTLDSAIGDYSITNNTETGVGTNPFLLDLESLDVSSTGPAAHALVITAEVTGLTSPLGAAGILSELSGHAVFGAGTVGMQTYINGTLVDTISPTTLASLSTGTLSATGAASLTNPWSVEEVFTVDATGTGIDDFSLDGSSNVAVPEPASLVIFGTALLGLGALRRRRNRV